MLKSTDVFGNAILSIIYAEVPIEVEEELVREHNKAVSEGQTSLTFEEWSGSMIMFGLRACQYKQLKKWWES